MLHVKNGTDKEVTRIACLSMSFSGTDAGRKLMIASNVRWLDWVLGLVGEGKESEDAERRVLRFDKMRECLAFEKDGAGDGKRMAAVFSAGASAKSPPGNLSVSTAILLSPNADLRARHPSTTCLARSRMLTICSAPSSSTGAESLRIRMVGSEWGSSGGGACVANRSRESERACEVRRWRTSAWDGAAGEEVRRGRNGNGRDRPPMSRITGGVQAGVSGATRHGWSKSAKGSNGRRGRKTSEEGFMCACWMPAACLYSRPI